MTHDEALDAVRELLAGYAADITPVGSTYVCGSGKDLDVLALVNHKSLAVNTAVERGYAPSLPDGVDYDGTFTSLRCGPVNLLLTEGKDYFQDFKAAAELCKAVGVVGKWQRVAVHKVVRDKMAVSDAVTYAQTKYGDAP